MKLKGGTETLLDAGTNGLIVGNTVTVTVVMPEVI